MEQAANIFTGPPMLKPQPKKKHGLGAMLEGGGQDAG